MSQGSVTQTDWLSVVARRLHSVQDSLVTLKDTPADPKTLHDARVACRRAEAVLRICRDVLPDRHADWLRKHLRQLRDVCNSARDNDVLRKWLDDQSSPAVCELQKLLKDKRHADQSLIVEFTKSPVRRRRFAHQAKRACEAATDGGQLEDWRPSLARRLLDELHHFVRALPTDGNNSRELHRLRIAGKRLRYACEFVSEVIPSARFVALQRFLKQNQDQLGVLHDIVVRQSCLKQLAKHAIGAQWQRDSADEQDRLTEAWREWWLSISLEAAIGSATTKLLKLICKP